jgi:hypothetical protein
MKATVEELLSVRRPGPRPDPLPNSSRDPWAIHAPYMIGFLAVLLGSLLLAPRDFGLLASGAALGAVLTYGVQRKILRGCQAAYYGSGLLMVALFEGANTAGGYALVAGLFLVVALGAKAAAKYFTPTVAPLAGRVPWRFEDVYRIQIRHFGIGGITAALVIVAFVSNPALRVLGVAVLPLCLRSYSDPMLSSDARRKLWGTVAAFQAIALLLVVPSNGPIAAAWIVVVCETVLFVGTSLIISERSGANVYQREQVAAGIGAGTILASIALPGSTVLYLVLAAVLGALMALIYLPKRAA